MITAPSSSSLFLLLNSHYHFYLKMLEPFLNFSSFPLLPQVPEHQPTFLSFNGNHFPLCLGNCFLLKFALHRDSSLTSLLPLAISIPTLSKSVGPFHSENFAVCQCGKICKIFFFSLNGQCAAQQRKNQQNEKASY